MSNSRIWQTGTQRLRLCRHTSRPPLEQYDPSSAYWPASESYGWCVSLPASYRQTSMRGQPHKAWSMLDGGIVDNLQLSVSTRCCKLLIYTLNTQQLSNASTLSHQPASERALKAQQAAKHCTAHGVDTSHNGIKSFGMMCRYFALVVGEAPIIKVLDPHRESALWHAASCLEHLTPGGTRT